MNRLKTALGILILALPAISAASVSTTAKKFCVLQPTTRGLSADKAAAVSKTIATALAAPRVVVVSSSVCQLKEKCIHTAHCLKDSCGKHKIDAVVQVDLFRVGPRVKTTITFYNGTTGEVALGTACTIPVEELAASTSLQENLTKGVTALQAQWQKQLPQSEPRAEAPQPASKLPEPQKEPPLARSQASRGQTKQHLSSIPIPWWQVGVGVASAGAAMLAAGSGAMLLQFLVINPEIDQKSQEAQGPGSLFFGGALLAAGLGAAVLGSGMGVVILQMDKGKSRTNSPDIPTSAASRPSH